MMLLMMIAALYNAFVQSETIINRSPLRESEGSISHFAHRPVSVTAAPHNNSLLIALQYNKRIWTISLTSLQYVDNLYSFDSDYTYGTDVWLEDGAMNTPRAVFPLTSSAFGIVDMHNHCIRKAEYVAADGRYWLSDIAGKSHQYNVMFQCPAGT